MLRQALPCALPVCLVFLLSACGQEPPAKITISPALVVQPQPSAVAMQSYPGEVRARFDPQLAFRIGGKVTKRLVDEGERVKANQPLAELDPQDVRLQLEATRAQVAAGQANLNLVRAERDRYKTLLDRQMVSRSQYDNAENMYRAGEAKLQQLKAEQDVASNQASYAVLRAPQDGVIAQRQVEVGQVVAAGQTVFTLAADGEREVLISLPEQAFGRFKIGLPVEVELLGQKAFGHFALFKVARRKAGTLSGRYRSDGYVPQNTECDGFTTASSRSQSSCLVSDSKHCATDLCRASGARSITAGRRA